MTFDVCNWLLRFSIEFTQSTWSTTTKSIGKFLQNISWKFFPIDFQSPIDFSQLHMIRALVYRYLLYTTSTYNMYTSRYIVSSVIGYWYYDRELIYILGTICVLLSTYIDILSNLFWRYPVSKDFLLHRPLLALNSKGTFNIEI